MNKKYNPQLLNTVVSGTGMKSPRIPTVILGEEKFGGYVAGDLMDANAIVEMIKEIFTDTSIEGPYVTKEELHEILTGLLNNAPEQLDTLGELATALGEDADFRNTITHELSSLRNDVQASVDGDNLVIGN